MTGDTGNVGANPDADDQSIESVLHSIRRILKEDDTAQADHDAAKLLAEDAETLTLDRSMLVSSETREADTDLPSASDTDRSLLAIAQRAQDPYEPPFFDAPRPAATVTDEGLMGDQTLAAAERSLDALHEALSRHERRQTVTGATPVSAGSLTIEDMVRQEVRAMVRVWLDAHLPSLVEIMVRAEISKMTRR